jgi:hypothetical protein
MSRRGWACGVFVAAACACLTSLSASAQSSAAWEQWQHQVGIVDVGVRDDGTLVTMVNGHFLTVDPATGVAARFADGQGGFSADPSVESYFVVVDGDQAVDGSACIWASNDVYVLDLSSPLGIAQVNARGQSTHFATLTGVDTLGGIALDRGGSFGHQLLVTGTHDSNQTTVFRIDCAGNVAAVTTSAPPVEGGLAVAPSTFGRFAGTLIAPDENSGQVWSIDPTGDATLVAVPSLSAGGDTGVESLGFVPPGFITGRGAAPAFAYLADRGTPNNPFPGTDSLLRITSSALAAAGVQDSDLLVATEGNGTTVAIRCADTCQTFAVAQGTSGGHIEGHVILAAASR